VECIAPSASLNNNNGIGVRRSKINCFCGLYIVPKCIYKSNSVYVCLRGPSAHVPNGSSSQLYVLKNVLLRPHLCIDVQNLML
jgi:hypothetical protein